MKKLLLALLLLVVAANVGFGASLCTSFGTLSGLIGTGAAGCDYNGINFNNFGLFAGGTQAAQVQATAIGVAFNSVGSVIDLSFNPGWDVSVGQSFDARIVYTVNAPVLALGLGYTGFTVFQNGGTTTVSENYWVNCTSFNAIGCGGPTGSLGITSGGPTFASVNLGQNSSITVSKDILADATNVQGSGIAVHLSGVDNLVTIPEPLTLGLMGFGLLGVGIFGRRAKK